MIDATEVERLAADLRHAERSATPTALLTDQHPGFSWDDARAVARATDRLRTNEGDTMIGYKLGWTSAAMREALGIDRPNWGTLWNSQLAADGLVTHELIHPKVEPELVYRVPASAVGVVPDGPDEVAGWNGEWALGIEVVDPRFPNYGFRWLDNTADNSSAARVVIGCFAMIDTVDPDAVTVEFSNGHDVRRGVGANAMGTRERPSPGSHDRCAPRGRVWSPARSCSPAASPPRSMSVPAGDTRSPALISHLPTPPPAPTEYIRFIAVVAHRRVLPTT